MLVPKCQFRTKPSVVSGRINSARARIENGVVSFLSVHERAGHVPTFSVRTGGGEKFFLRAGKEQNLFHSGILKVILKGLNQNKRINVSTLPELNSGEMHAIHKRNGAE